MVSGMVWHGANGWALCQARSTYPLRPDILFIGRQLLLPPCLRAMLFWSAFLRLSYGIDARITQHANSLFFFWVWEFVI